jgi:hypothetical protein
MPGLAMNSLTRLGFFLMLLSSPLAAVGQCTAADREKAADRAHAQAIRIGNAKVRTAPDWIGAGPNQCLQPDVYWHDDHWKIDVLEPARDNDPFSIGIRSGAGQEKTVALDFEVDQVASVWVTPNEEAIVVGWVYGRWSGLFSLASIFDLKSGASVDRFTAQSFSISPNRRFLLYLNVGGINDQQTEPPYQYRLYDVLKTPRENTCGYRINDPQHKFVDDDHRGFPLYPKRPHRASCSDADLQPFERDDHDWISDFLWSDDSSKVVFVDEGNQGSLSVVAVTTPMGSKDLPRTAIDHLGGGPGNVDSKVGIAWSDAPETAVSVRTDGARTMVIPLSKFVAVP